MLGKGEVGGGLEVFEGKCLVDGRKIANTAARGFSYF